MDKVRTAILISGRGSNMVSLVEASKEDSFPAQIDLVISNRPDAAGLEKSSSLGIQSMVIDHKAFKSRDAFETALHAVLTEANIDLVCCAGFMRVLTEDFVSKWEGRLINIHPSLLPKYKGLNTHARAIENGDTVHGCTVHHVTVELDSGAVILQEQINILESDTPDTLAARLIAVEMETYPKALETVAKTMLATNN